MGSVGTTDSEYIWYEIQTCTAILTDQCSAIVNDPIGKRVSTVKLVSDSAPVFFIINPFTDTWALRFCLPSEDDILLVFQWQIRAQFDSHLIIRHNDAWHACTLHRHRGALLPSEAIDSLHQISQPTDNELTLWRTQLPYGYSYEASYAVICNFWHPGTLVLTAERQSARMSQIADNGLTRSDTKCFIAVPIWQLWASKG